MFRPHPRENAPADTHRNRHGTLAPHSVPTPAPPPSAQSYRSHSGYRGPWSHLSWVSPLLGPDQGNSYGTYPVEWTQGLAARFVGSFRNGFDTPQFYRRVQGSSSSLRHRGESVSRRC